MQSFDYSAVDEILMRHDARAQAVIAILQEVQERYHYLPEPVFPYLARRMHVSEASIYSVATFYEYFSLIP